MRAMRLRARRAIGVPVVALTMVMVLGGPVVAGSSVPSEKQTGAVGHYLVIDGLDTPGAKCWYAAGDPPKLTRFRVKAPSLWWPDRDSGDNNEHGRVGWQIRIQSAPDPSVGPWSTIFKTSTLKATAYEDFPTLHDPAKRAPFTRRVINWNAPGNNYYRLIQRLIWYESDGSIRGTLRHWISGYRLAGAVSGVSFGNCANNVTEL
jgi:hypothetical protein